MIVLNIGGAELSQYSAECFFLQVSAESSGRRFPLSLIPLCDFDNLIKTSIFFLNLWIFIIFLHPVVIMLQVGLLCFPVVPFLGKDFV